jgi:hypothetical protein
MKVIQSFDADTYTYLSEVDKLPDYHDELTPENFAVVCGPQVRRLGLVVVIFDQPLPWYNVVGLPCDSMRTAGAVLYLLKYYRRYNSWCLY